MSKVKQSMFPEIERLEINQVNQDISQMIEDINVAINRMCPDGNYIPAKRNFCNILKILSLSIEGLRYLNKNSRGYGVLIISRTEFSTEEKIFIRATYKSRSRDENGRVLEVLTNEKKLYSESLPKIEWNDIKDEFKKTGFRRDIDG